MTDAHLHKIQWIRLCDGHSGAMSVMKEMHKRFSSNATYYQLCNQLHTYNIVGSQLYDIWKEKCQEDYHLFLTYDVHIISHS
jgi:hypothetical protein